MNRKGGKSKGGGGGGGGGGGWKGIRAMRKKIEQNHKTE